MAAGLETGAGYQRRVPEPMGLCKATYDSG